MKKRVLMLGAGVMQGPALRIAKSRGWEAIAVDGDPSAACVGEAARFERIDLKDKEAIEAFARRLKAEGGLDGVLTAGTDFSANVAWVAERLGLPGIPYEVALDASDKARMRARFRAEGVPSPEFFVATSPAQAEADLPFPFPVVVKPVDNMGSRGCRRADDKAALRAAAADALGYSRSGRAIVEQFMEGPEFSVDSLVKDGRLVVCGLADRHIFFPPYFIEMGHTIPTDLSPADAERLLAVFERGVRALGIRDGAAKGDVKLTPAGPMIGEIAARLSGGYMSGWTYPYCSGVEPTAGALSIAVGDDPGDLSPKKTWTCAERAFISIPGVVAELRGVEAARSRPHVNDVFLRAAPSLRVRFPENNVSKCGNVIASAPTRAEAVSAAEGAARSILVRLVPGDAETDAFLAEGDILFPPSAFALSAAQRSALAALPEGPRPGSAASAPAGALEIIAFPELQISDLADLVGRGVGDCLAAASSLAGVGFSIVEPGAAAPQALGRSFWTAFVRGGYQGAAYFVESLLAGGAGR